MDLVAIAVIAAAVVGLVWWQQRKKKPFEFPEGSTQAGKKVD